MSNKEPIPERRSGNIRRHADREVCPFHQLMREKDSVICQKISGITDDAKLLASRIEVQELNHEIKSKADWKVLVLMVGITVGSFGFIWHQIDKVSDTIKSVEHNQIKIMHDLGYDAITQKKK